MFMLQIERNDDFDFFLLDHQARYNKDIEILNY